MWFSDNKIFFELLKENMHEHIYRERERNTGRKLGRVGKVKERERDLPFTHVKQIK